MGVFERAPALPRIDLAEEAEFDLGGMHVIPAERSVVFNGERRELQPRVMQVLVALAKAGTSVVSRDRLVDLCWSGRVVGDDALNRVILSLRHLAQEFTPPPFTIETVPRVGHRLIPSGDRQYAPMLANRRGLMVAGSAVAIVGVVGLGWAWQQTGLPSEARPLVEDAKASIADGNVEQIGNAVAKLKNATRLAPDSAEVWGLLALAYQKQARFAPEEERSRLVVRGLESAKRSLAIDSDQPDARAAIILAMPEFRNWLAFESACRSAWQAHPRHPDINWALAKLLAQVGRSAEALRHLDMALAARPMASRLHVFRTNLLWSLGRLEEAESEIEKAFDLWPRNNSIWFTRFYFLMHNGRPETAAAMFADAANRPIGIPEWNFQLSVLQARALEGDAAMVGKALEASRNAARQGTGFAQNAIVFAGAANAMDAAFELMDAYYFGKGFSVGETYFTKEQGVYSSALHRDTYFLFWRPMANVRHDPRFGRLTARLGLEDYWRRSGAKPDYRR